MSKRLGMRGNRSAGVSVEKIALDIPRIGDVQRAKDEAERLAHEEELRLLKEKEEIERQKTIDNYDELQFNARPRQNIALPNMQQIMSGLTHDRNDPFALRFRAVGATPRLDINGTVRLLGDMTLSESFNGVPMDDRSGMNDDMINAIIASTSMLSAGGREASTFRNPTAIARSADAPAWLQSVNTRMSRYYDDRVSALNDCPASQHIRINYNVLPISPEAGRSHYVVTHTLHRGRSGASNARVRILSDRVADAMDGAAIAEATDDVVSGFANFSEEAPSQLLVLSINRTQPDIRSEYDIQRRDHVIDMERPIYLVTLEGIGSPEGLVKDALDRLDAPMKQRAMQYVNSRRGNEAVSAHKIAAGAHERYFVVGTTGTMFSVFLMDPKCREIAATRSQPTRIDVGNMYRLALDMLLDQPVR